MKIVKSLIIRAALATALLLPGLAHASIRERGASMYHHAGSPALSRAGSAILAEAERFLGRGNPTPYREAWCRDFVNMILERTGHRLADRTHIAATAVRLGPRVAQPKPGDIVVMRRHVGFVVAIEGGAVRMISGNYGKRVAFGLVPRRQVVAFVRT